MEMEKCQPQTHQDKKFDFYETEWVIEEFCLASYRDRWEFESPEFTVRGFHSTKWLMILEQASNAAGKFIKWTLKRSDSDAGPDKVWVDRRMNIAEYTANCNYSVNKICCFQKGSTCSDDWETEDIVIGTLKPFESDLVTVRCKLLFYYEDVSMEFQMCADEGIRCLSDNFLELFYSSQDCDLELHFKDKVILAHRIIACSRIGELNYLLQQDSQKLNSCALPDREALDLSFLNYDAMRKILKYAYTGDRKLVLAHPSLAISDCVWKLNISELKPYYTPNKLFFKTSMDSQEFRIKWLIPNISSLMCHEVVLSPQIVDDHFGTTWQFKASLKNEGNTDYFAIHAETIGEIEPLDICLEFAMSDKSGGCFFLKRMRCLTEGLKPLGFDKFVSGNVAKSFSDNNCLQMIGRLQLSDGLFTSFTEKQEISFVTCTSAEKCYSLLSADMESAFDSGFFSDLHLENNGVLYKIHKCIVATRCSVMYDMIRQMELDDANTFPDIEPNIFCHLLKYLYTGTLSTECGENFVKLYRVAVDFNLYLLKDKCLKCLKDLVKSNLVIRAKVLEVSQQHNDDALKNVALQYISEV